MLPVFLSRYGRVCFFVLLAVLCGTGLACRASAQSPCEESIAVAERAAGIPARLLGAIGKVESGRRVGGAIAAWPWTINVEGQGYFYESKQEAIEAVRAFQAQGARSIDVGCMQINLLHHPDAFPSLEDAFDPLTNARFGARFLGDLFQRVHGWLAAAAAYHSFTPALGEDYARRVEAVWRQGGDALSFDDPSPGMATPPRAAGRGVPFVQPHFRPYPGMSFAPPPRIIHRPASSGIAGLPASAAPGGSGRSLAAYRASPVRLAFRR